jgi:hypothetical protein
MSEYKTKPGDVLGFEGVRHVVALHHTIPVVKESADVPAAFDIFEAQRIAAAQDHRPARTTLDGVFPQGHKWFTPEKQLQETGNCRERIRRREGRSRRPSWSGGEERGSRSCVPRESAGLLAHEYDVRPVRPAQSKESIRSIRQNSLLIALQS